MTVPAPRSCSSSTFIFGAASLHKVGARFRITIDRPIRERLGVEPGDLAVRCIEDGHVVIEFIPRPHDRSLRGILKGSQRPPGSTDAAAEKEAAWLARSAEVIAALAADSTSHRTRMRATAS